MTRITRRTADIMVSVAAALYKVRQHNCQRSLHKKGSGKVPVDFQTIKVQIIFPGLIYILGHHAESTPTPLTRSPWWPKASRQSATGLFAQHCPSGLISLPERKVRAGPTLIAPGQLPYKLEGGHLNHHQRRVCFRHSAVERLLQKVHLHNGDYA